MSSDLRTHLGYLLSRPVDEQPDLVELVRLLHAVDDEDTESQGESGDGQDD